MHRGLIGLAMLAGVVLLNPVGGYASAQQSGEQTQSAPEEDTDGAELSAITDALERIAAAQDAQNARSDPASDEQRAQDDLSAQQEMARWAGPMFVATAAATVVGFFGVAALIGTFLAQQDLARRQSRAYVMLSEGAWLMPLVVGQVLRANIAIRNVGQTPAYRMRIVRSLTIRAFDDLGEFNAGRMRFPDRAPVTQVLGPDIRRDLPCASNGPLTDEEVAGVQAGTHGVFIDGVVEYEDAFKKVQRTRFRAVHGGDIARETGQLGFWPEGNEAT